MSTNPISAPTNFPMELPPLNPQAPARTPPTQEKPPLSPVNLATFEIWENFIQEGEAITIDQAKGWLGRTLGFVDGLFRKDGKTQIDDIHARCELERRLMKESKRRVEAHEADSILSSLKQISESGPEDLKKRASQLLEEARIHTPDGSYLLGHLIRYVSNSPQDKARTEQLFNDADQTEIRYAGAQTPFAIYALLQATSSDAPLKTYCGQKLATLKEGKSAARMVVDLLRTVGTDDLAQIATMAAATKIGAVARLATLDKAKNLGITGYKAVALGWGAGLAAEGTTMWALNTAQESAFHDTEKSLDAKHLAKSYGANLVMLGAIKPFSAVGGSIRGRLAQSVERTGEGILGSKTATQALGWSVQHAFGLSGMVASTQINQGLGLHETPQGGFTESFIHDAFGYAKYGFAQEGFDHLLGADFVQKNKELHETIARREGELIAAEKLKPKKYAHPLLNPLLQPALLLVGAGGLGGMGGDSGPKGDTPAALENWRREMSQLIAEKQTTGTLHLSDFMELCQKFHEPDVDWISESEWDDHYDKLTSVIPRMTLEQVGELFDLWDRLYKAPQLGDKFRIADTLCDMLLFHPDPQIRKMATEWEKSSPDGSKVMLRVLFESVDRDIEKSKRKKSPSGKGGGGWQVIAFGVGLATLLASEHAQAAVDLATSVSSSSSVGGILGALGLGLGALMMAHQNSRSKEEKGAGIRKLLAALENPEDPLGRREAIRKLQATGEKNFLPALRGMLKDPDSGVREAAALAVDYLDGSDPAKEVAKALPRLKKNLQGLQKKQDRGTETLDDYLNVVEGKDAIDEWKSKVAFKNFQIKWKGALSEIKPEHILELCNRLEGLAEAPDSDPIKKRLSALRRDLGVLEINTKKGNYNVSGIVFDWTSVLYYSHFMTGLFSGKSRILWGPDGVGVKGYHLAMPVVFDGVVYPKNSKMSFGPDGMPLSPENPADKKIKGSRGSGSTTLVALGAGLATLLASEHAQAGSELPSQIGYVGAGAALIGLGIGGFLALRKVVQAHQNWRREFRSEYFARLGRDTNSPDPEVRFKAFKNLVRLEDSGAIKDLSAFLERNNIQQNPADFLDDIQKERKAVRDAEGIMTVDQKIDRHQLPVDEGGWDKFDDLFIARLTQATEIQGLHLDSGIIQVYENGLLAAGILLRDCEVSGIHYRLEGAGGTRVGFHPNGALHKVTLAKPIEIDGQHYGKNAELYFDPNGQLLKAESTPGKKRPWWGGFGFGSVLGMGAGLATLLASEPAQASDSPVGMGPTEQGVLLAITAALTGTLLARHWFTKWMSSPDRLKLDVLWREKKGLAREGLLLSDQNVLGLPLPRGTSVRFNGEGDLRELQLSDDAKLFDYNFLRNDRIHLDNALKLKEVTLAGDGIFMGHRYRVHDTLEFNGEGKLAGANLRTDQTIHGLPLRAHSHVKFFPNGQIDFGFLAGDHDIGGVPCADGFVSFHPNGRLKSAELAKETDIDGILLEKGSRIERGPEGEMAGMKD